LLIDSGASASVVSSDLSHLFSSSSVFNHQVATAGNGHTLVITHKGSLGGLSNVLVSPTIRHNCISVSQLCDLGLELHFSSAGLKISSPFVSVQGSCVNGLYELNFQDLEKVVSPELLYLYNIGSHAPDIDEVDLWHRRWGDTAHHKLIEAVRNKLVEGISLDRKYFSAKGRKSYKCACDVCARAKMHEVSFPAVRDRLKGLSPGDYVSSDVLIFNSIPSREGYNYVLFVVDHASKRNWVFPLKTRQSKELLKHLVTFISEILPSQGITMKRWHSDGGAELVAQEVLSTLHKNGTTTSHSPRDTPQMNSVTERWVRSLKERVLCLLLRSSLPVAFWWWAVSCASYLLNRTPTTTARGYMTPFECVTNVAPNLKFLRVWGCKCYALKPKAERLKDMDDKAYTGFLVGYSEQNTGYIIFVPALNKTIVSVHVVFNEIIPDPTADYFSELDKLKIDVAAESKDPADFEFLVGLNHLDDEDGLVYQTTRVVVHRSGYIVAYRRLINTDSGACPREEKTPIHVADVVRMTSTLTSSPPSAGDLATPSRTDPPVADHHREAEAQRTPSEALGHPSWNSKGRLLTGTPAQKRSRLPSGSRPLSLDLSKDFATTGEEANQECNTVDALLSFTVPCPKSYQQALRSQDAVKWQASMATELTALTKRHCWDVVPYPSPGTNLLRCHFVYKIKTKLGKVERLKSRLVVDGSKQIQGVDVDETFAPVVKYNTLRIFLAIAAVNNMRVHQIDVENAFIHADLTETVFMHPHPEMHVPAGHCLRLRKSLYGLKQAPRNWNVMLNATLLHLNFTRSKLDHCIYMGVVDGHEMLVAVFVDDILIACSSVSAINKVIAIISKKFPIKDMGRAEEFLSIRLQQAPGRITLDQSHYIADLVEKRYPQYVGSRNSATLPFVNEYIPRGEAPATDKQRAYVDTFPYGEIVGCLLYLSVVTRVDIAYAVGVLTRHVKHPTYAACKAATRVLSYLALTRNKGLCYSGTILNFLAYTDSDWASDQDTRRSTSGYVVLMAGAPVCWMSKLQAVVAVSSMEAEYIACFYCVQEITWIRMLLEDLRLTRSLPTRVYIDNRSARLLMLNPVHHARSKHIDIKYHWQRDKVQDNTFKPLYVPTLEQRADIFTKHTSAAIFHKHCNAMIVDIN
jgi:hypothetical protein